MLLFLHLGAVAFILGMRTSPLDWRVELQECLPDGGFLLPPVEYASHNPTPSTTATELVV